LRTLIKGASVQALALVGFATPPGVLSVDGPVLRELHVPEEGEIFFDAAITASDASAPGSASTSAGGTRSRPAAPPSRGPTRSRTPGQR
jgi:hypothetical protein